MARFTVSKDLNLEWRGRSLIGVAGTTHRIPDEFYAEFVGDFVGGKSGQDLPGLTWISVDESTSSGGAHPDLAAHGHTQDSHNHTQDAHTHTQNAHLHDEYNNSSISGGLVGWGAQDTSTNTASLTGYDTGSTTATNQNATATNQAATATNQNTGGGGAHNNLQPYIVVFMWKRTA